MCDCNAEAELTVVRHDLEVAMKTLVNFREMHAKMSKDILTLTEERDLAPGGSFMYDNLVEEIEELKEEVKQKSEQINSWRRLWVLKGNAIRELRATLSNTKAELSDVRSDLADTTATLDTCRKMRFKMDNAICTLTEERDLARELFQGMMREYADLLDRYTKSCDEYEKLASRFIWRNDAEHAEF